MNTERHIKFVEETYGKPYEEVVSVAKSNLMKAGCPANKIDFVIKYGGIFEAYENDLPFEMMKTNPMRAIEYLTTD